MHKIYEKEFTLEDFSCEHLSHTSLEACIGSSYGLLKHTINVLNKLRNLYLETKVKPMKEESKRAELMKKYWWQMIQLLPSSYNQKRTVMMNYEVLANIYESRKNHKLDEWSIGFMEWIESLPYSELICGHKFLSNKLHVGIDLAHGDDMKGGGTMNRTTKINILAYASEPDKDINYDGDIIEYKGKRYFVSLANERVEFVGVVRDKQED